MLYKRVKEEDVVEIVDGKQNGKKEKIGIRPTEETDIPS